MVKPDSHVSIKLYFLAVLANVLIPVTKYRARSEEKSGTDLLVLCLKGTSPSWQGWHDSIWLHGERNLLQLLSADKGAETEDTVGPEINMKACPPQWLKSSSQDPPAKGATTAPNSPLSLGPRVQTMADFLQLILITPSLSGPLHISASLSYLELQPGNR